ncbi:GNAT family N-acetyltransferase [Tessaracoccus rhinocerotis]|uniref:GNAT family N-acetyltransferase n=1 Tax=Tessaracoccus rhinocerotis TaxID=1689449 RepID=A0A553JXZ5_9ACTN|nr:GNAT family N-acetyltransferase [Tessaracoccus rhinocerotis]
MRPSVQVTLVEQEMWWRLRDIRLAALTDSPDMFGSTLVREQAFTEGEWRRRAQRPSSFLASRSGQDIGVAGVHEFGGTWTVVGMWIAPRARGTGVVEALMEACEAVARGSGANEIVLGVMEDNAAGRNAYRRLGFEPTGRRDRLHGGRRELCLSKTLVSREEPMPPSRPLLSELKLVPVDEAVLDELIGVAMSDAEPDDVTPPLGDGWTTSRVEWLRAFHRQRRAGLSGGDEETAAIRTGNRIVGATRLHRSSIEDPEQLEYGIWLARSARGRGLSHEVLRLVAARAVALGASRLVLRTKSSNAPVIATLRRAGASIQQGCDGNVVGVIALDTDAHVPATGSPAAVTAEDGKSD